MNTKLGKKPVVYGTLLSASLALLAGQAIVGRSAPRRAPPRPWPSESAPDATTAPDATLAASAGTHTNPEAGADVRDERVLALESSIETLESLLPADRSQELERIGRGWAIDRREVEPTPESPVAAPSAPRTALPEVAAAPASLDGAEELGGESPAAAAFREWFDKHPLTAIAISGNGRLAAIGGELYAVGDELPDGLGTITAIDARAIRVAQGGVAAARIERRVALGALALRPREAPQAPAAGRGPAEATSLLVAPAAMPLNPKPSAAAPGANPAAAANAKQEDKPHEERR